MKPNQIFLKLQYWKLLEPCRKLQKSWGSFPKPKKDSRSYSESFQKRMKAFSSSDLIKISCRNQPKNQTCGFQWNFRLRPRYFWVGFPFKPLLTYGSKWISLLVGFLNDFCILSAIFKLSSNFTKKETCIVSASVFIDWLFNWQSFSTYKIDKISFFPSLPIWDLNLLFLLHTYATVVKSWGFW